MAVKIYYTIVDQCDYVLDKTVTVSLNYKILSFFVINSVVEQLWTTTAAWEWVQQQGSVETRQ